MKYCHDELFRFPYFCPLFYFTLIVFSFLHIKPRSKIRVIALHLPNRLIRGIFLFHPDLREILSSAYVGFKNHYTISMCASILYIDA